MLPPRLAARRSKPDAATVPAGEAAKTEFPSAFRRRAADAQTGADLAALRELLNAETGALSAYDLRMCMAALKQLQNRLDAQARSAPFSFASSSVGGAPPSEPRSPEAPLPDVAESVKEPMPQPGAPAPHSRRARLDIADDGEVAIKDVADCDVYVTATCKAMYLTNLVRCTVFAGPVNGSLLARNLHFCTVHVASRQARIHGSSHCALHVRTCSDPVIEACTDLTFHAFALDGVDFSSAGPGLQSDSGRWRAVKDFSWMKSTPSPNFRVVA